MEMSANKETGVTVQGRDTPVPVVDSGGKAGHTRPSSSDRGSSEVDNQATGGLFATGREGGDIVNPFTRRDSLKRTPPRVGSQKEGRKDGDSDTNIQTITIDADEDEVFEEKCTQKTKSKRVVTPEKSEIPAELEELRNYIKKLNASCKALKLLVSVHPNTKVEIKKEIVHMGRTMEVLRRKCHEWEELPKVVQLEKEKETNKIGIQVNMDRYDSEEEKEREREEVRKILNEGTTLSDIECILDKEWPGDVYEHVKVESGTPTQVEYGRDIALVIETNPDTEKGFLKGMIGKHPEIGEFIREGMTNGRVEYIENITKTTTSRRTAGETKNFIFLLPQEIHEGGINEVEPFHNSMIGLREE